MGCARNFLGQFPKSVSLNGNAAVIDLDFNTIRLLPVLVNLIAQYNNNDPQSAADEVKQFTVHRIVNV